ncbi:hypothetical protein BDN71DRAFT_1450300 [Pleurotus eryngii]|uniref:Uncharacterized protein n=1 Tax=Pleurotus eryngii TaxID=5323 RepID=A0A9P5ZS55_PLEER|nr:hypothetical protein BDN71DRAFT_1450300 [Pleurotus eryngii]
MPAEALTRKASKARIDAMFSHLEPHPRPDYPKCLTDPPPLSQEDINAMFPNLPAGLRPYYVALGNLPPPLKKGLFDLGKSDKGPGTRSKSRRIAQFGVTNGATELLKEEEKVVGRSKRAMKRKRAAGVDNSEINATATAPTSGKGKEKNPARTKSGEKVTNGTVKKLKVEHMEAHQRRQRTSTTLDQQNE